MVRPPEFWPAVAVAPLLESCLSVQFTVAAHRAVLPAGILPVSALELALPVGPASLETSFRWRWRRWLMAAYSSCNTKLLIQTDAGLTPQQFVAAVVGDLASIMLA